MPEQPHFEADFVRHSVSGYRSYAEIAGSENPTAPFDPEQQLIPDLTEAGKALAELEAEKFFAALDPQDTTVFFVSSNEARALETANIYRKIAHEKGFEVQRPEHVRSEIAAQIGGGEIRTLDTLSPNYTNMLYSTIFNPEKTLAGVNIDAMDADTKRKWDEGRAIIQADDRGSWGANFHAHSVAMKEIFPEIKTSGELFETSFKNMMRLVRFGQKKTEEAGTEKNVKVLGFSHENYVLAALERYFQEQGMKNCEVIRFAVDDAAEKSAIRGTFRGKTADIE